MAKDEHDGVEQAGEVDRRSGLAGGAATKDETTGLDGGGLGTLGAIYQPYPQNFSSKFFSAAEVRGSVQRIKSVLPTRDALWWGNYQKYAPANPRDKTNWGNDATLYDNWEAAVDEAREALRKQPVDSGRPGPDPDHPTELAHNLLDHLDKTVRIALWDKHQLNHPNESGIEIVVKVFPQGLASRRHNLLTSWHEAPVNPSGDPKYKYDKLTIAMTCPVGGWIGTAVWHYTGPSRFTRFTATYTVPALPEHDSGQIIFIFNGLESLPDPQRSDPPGILQPVLQWTQPDGARMGQFDGSCPAYIGGIILQKLYQPFCCCWAGLLA